MQCTGSRCGSRVAAAQTAEANVTGDGVSCLVLGSAVGIWICAEVSPRVEKERVGGGGVR